MNLRISIILTGCLCLAALFSLVWATTPAEQTTGLPVADSNGGNLKDLKVGKVSIRDVSSARQSISVRGEIMTLQVTTPKPEVVYTSNRGGGETIATATVIPMMPYIDSGTTTGFADDYQETCTAPQIPQNPDVVYSYTPTIDELVDISLCDTTYGDYPTYLWIYDEDTNVVACNRFGAGCMGTPSTARSVLEDVPMDSGLAYYIVVDGDYQFGLGYGNYVISCDAEPAPQPSDSVQRWPGFADNGDSALMLGYSFNNNIDSQLFWQASINDGATFESAVYWSLNDWAKYASVDYWGFDTTFYGTYVPGAGDNSGGQTCLNAFYNIYDNGPWVLRRWPWQNSGWHDMRMADIACDTGGEFSQRPGVYAFGVISIVHSSTYTDPDLVDAPHLFYEIDTTIDGYASISWYNDLNGCNSTMCDIDKVSTLSYAVYDWWNSAESQWQLFIRRDLFSDMKDQTYKVGYTYSLEPGEYTQHPAVAVHNGSIVIATEFTTDTDTTDHDIICWYDPGDTNGVSLLFTSVIVATPDDERYPRVAHVAGSQFLCTYVANNALYMVLSTDGGETWGTPEVISGTDHVVSEYRSADIAEGAAKVIWEYQPGLPDDTSIFLHWANTNLIQDTDGDGIPDDGDGSGTAGDTPCIGGDTTDCDDNCMLVPNPNQEDADADGVGDVCDTCTDTDGDGYGNPGFPTNTCTLDNCPDTANPSQADTDSNGVGDACCCVDRGNVDGIVGIGGPIDVADLTYLVEHMFNSPSGPAPPCPEQGNVDGTETTPGIPIDVADLTFLVAYLFQNGPAPPPCP